MLFSLMIVLAYIPINSELGNFFLHKLINKLKNMEEIGRFIPEHI